MACTVLLYSYDEGEGLLQALPDPQDAIDKVKHVCCIASGGKGQGGAMLGCAYARALHGILQDIPL